MKYLIPFILVFLFVMMACAGESNTTSTTNQPSNKSVTSEPIVSSAEITLPAPTTKGTVSVEEALNSRRSVRHYSDKPITLAQVGQLLWAAQGITEPKRKLRTAPSAMACYPLEVYILINNGDGVSSGIYKYEPEEHKLLKLKEKDESNWVNLGGAAILVYSAVYERVTDRCGKIGETYVHMEAGHSSQNVCLQAVALGLDTVVIGGFNPDKVGKVIGLPAEEKVLYMMRLGYKG